MSNLVLDADQSDRLILVDDGLSWLILATLDATAVALVPGMEWTVDAARLHWTVDEPRAHWTVDTARPHWETLET